jgi:hypothetical protein
MRVALVALTSLLLSSILGATSFASTAGVEGRVVLSQTTPVAVLIWDATKPVYKLASQNVTNAAGVKAIELSALTLLQQRAPTLKAATIEIHVVYVKSLLALQYGNPLMADKTNLFDLVADRAAAMRDGAKWPAEVAAGNKVDGLTFKVNGKMPAP